MQKKLQNKLVGFAKECLGNQYKYGAKPEEAPEFFDCSSFIQYVYKKIGVELPRTALEQAHCGKTIRFKESNLQIGDLLFFKGIVGKYDRIFPKGIGHVAMYIGENKTIRAKYKNNKDGSRTGKIQTDKLEKILESEDLVVIKRIF